MLIFRLRSSSPSSYQRFIKSERLDDTNAEDKVKVQTRVLFGIHTSVFENYGIRVCDAV